MIKVKTFATPIRSSPPCGSCGRPRRRGQAFLQEEGAEGENLCSDSTTVRGGRGDHRLSAPSRSAYRVTRSATWPQRTTSPWRARRSGWKREAVDRYVDHPAASSTTRGSSATGSPCAATRRSTAGFSPRGYAATARTRTLRSRRPRAGAALRSPRRPWMAADPPSRTSPLDAQRAAATRRRPGRAARRLRLRGRGGRHLRPVRLQVRGPRAHGAVQGARAQRVRAPKRAAPRHPEPAGGCEAGGALLPALRMADSTSSGRWRAARPSAPCAPAVQAAPRTTATGPSRGWHPDMNDDAHDRGRRPRPTPSHPRRGPPTSSSGTTGPRSTRRARSTTSRGSRPARRRSGRSSARSSGRTCAKGRPCCTCSATSAWTR